MSAEKTVKKSTQAQRLSLEMGTKMMTTFGDQYTAVKAFLVGMEPGSFLIIRLPELMGSEDFLVEGNKASVRYVSWGMVYGFQSRILGYHHKGGFNLVILSYPKAVKTYDLRKDGRTDSYVLATLTLGKDNFTGFLFDLSPSGCRFAFGKSSEKPDSGLELDQKVTVSFHLPDLEGTQTFVCKTQNIQHDEQSLSLGLQFDLESGAAFSPMGVLRYLEEKEQKK
ncbi:MAG: flagellar brake protein [Deltaproteobacteria bacterium]|nr:flagellar brake protein [Deltaproteobacteria bacterium]